jgi:hypothetical protein
MDVANVFKNEVFRPLVTVVIPGAIALFPYVLLANHLFPALDVYRGEHEPIYLTIVVLLTIAFGVLIGDIGSYVEVLFDKFLAKDFPKAGSEWYQYLQLPNSGTIGHGYLSAALLHLRFELAMGIAFIPFFAGMLIVNGHKLWFSNGAMWLMGLSLFVAFFILMYAAYTTSELMIQVRANMLKPKD